MTTQRSWTSWEGWTADEMLRLVMWTSGVVTVASFVLMGVLDDAAVVPLTALAWTCGMTRLIRLRVAQEKLLPPLGRVDMPSAGSPSDAM